MKVIAGPPSAYLQILFLTSRQLEVKHTPEILIYAIAVAFVRSANRSTLLAIKTAGDTRPHTFGADRLSLGL
jgi:hypothetical protein